MTAWAQILQGLHPKAHGQHRGFWAERLDLTLCCERINWELMSPWGANNPGNHALGQGVALGVRRGQVLETLWNVFMGSHQLTQSRSGENSSLVSGHFHISPAPGLPFSSACQFNPFLLRVTLPSVTWHSWQSRLAYFNNKGKNTHLQTVINRAAASYEGLYLKRFLFGTAFLFASG